jgi:ABC-type glutathione transport system ATPase component
MPQRDSTAYWRKMRAPMSLLRVENLQVHFPIRSGFGKSDVVKAVDGVSFEIQSGRTLGLVGESGSGKSTISRALLKLIQPTGGRALYQGQDIFPMSESAFRRLRKEMQMVFQDPIGSLNPRMTIESILSEPQEIHFKNRSRAERREASADLLQRVELPADSLMSSAEGSGSASASHVRSRCSRSS